MAIKLNITYQELTRAVEKRLADYQTQATTRPEDALFYRMWAFGALSLWETLTAGCYSDAKDKDYQRLLALSKCEQPTKEQ